MIQITQISPGVTLRCYKDTRFKQGLITIQLLRPMDWDEAATNALLPAVLLRGTQKHKDLRAITMHLDDLYGASVGDMVRRIGDYQAIGLACSFTEDRFALPGDRIMEPVVDFLRELLLEPATEGGVFRREFVESEKKNRIADIESEFNDKRSYAASSLMKLMCREDSFGIPRLGEKEHVAAITAASAYDQYQMLLKTSPVELFYVGSWEPEAVAELLRPLFEGVCRQPVVLPPQTPFRDGGRREERQECNATQSILNMGFVTPVTNTQADHAAMRVLNVIFGAGMTSKLFQNIREKMSLCYSIGSDYYGSKGILTVAAGIDADREQTVRQQILDQLKQCADGNITQQELDAAKEAMLSGLRGVYDSPRSIEHYFTTQALSGMTVSLEEYRKAIRAVTAADAARAAATLQEHTTFFLKGVG